MISNPNFAPGGPNRSRYFPVPIADGTSQIHPREPAVFPQGQYNEFQAPDSDSELCLKQSLSKALYEETTSHNDTRARLQATFSTWARWERALQIERNKSSNFSETNSFLRVQLDIALGKIVILEEKLRLIEGENKRLSGPAKRAESFILGEGTPDTLSDYYTADEYLIGSDRLLRPPKRSLHSPFANESSKRRKDSSPLPLPTPCYTRPSPCTPKAMYRGDSRESF
ncbi:hypothetical protein PVAG01_05975 [Phlyctema vagabunda]|uniref:Uncharacterized protein n=1 Tax=Phlyctema vagabunda TaxID=108571 RepID=A0ABR4PES0_9HELO